MNLIYNPWKIRFSSSSSLCLSVSLSLSLSVSSISLCLCMSVSLCLCLSVSVSLSLSVCLSVCLSLSLSNPSPPPPPPQPPTLPPKFQAHFIISLENPTARRLFRTLWCLFQTAAPEWYTGVTNWDLTPPHTAPRSSRTLRSAPVISSRPPPGHLSPTGYLHAHG